jgi:lysophospholipase L1-like esterase
MTQKSLLRFLTGSVLVPLAIAFALLLGLEGGCRLIGRARSGTWPETRSESYTRFVEKVGSCYERHPFLIVAGRPNAVLHVEGHDVRLNSRGQRSPETVVPKPPGVFRVVCEGGSTTYDLLAKDNEGTWPMRLGALLIPRHGDVVNAGLPGWTSAESLISLALRDVDLAPDLVVVYSGINDLQPAGHVPFTPDYAKGHADLLPRVLGVDRVPLRLVARSVFIEKLRDRLAPRAETTEGYAPAWEWKGGARKDDIPAEAVRVYERILRSTIGVARVHHAATLLVAQTVRFRKGREKADREYVESWTPGLTGDGYARGLGRYNEVARKLGDEKLALFLDPFAAGDFKDDDFADAVHFTASGSERFARRLAETIIGLIPARN